MLRLQTEQIADVAVVNCQGRIVRSDDAFKLRDEVTKFAQVKTIILDLSEVAALGGGGLGMLAFLQQWAQMQGIGFKLFDPSESVRHRLEDSLLHVKPEIVGTSEVLSLLGWFGKDSDLGLAA